MHQTIRVATPADWKTGEDIIIPATVSYEDAIEKFGTSEKFCRI